MISMTVRPVEEFYQWMAGFGLTSVPDCDPDGDSIINMVEYFIGGDPPKKHDSALLPNISLVTADPDDNSTDSAFHLSPLRFRESRSVSEYRRRMVYCA